MAADAPGRVHFDEQQLGPDHRGEITIILAPDKLHADAHLGFLQEKSKYEMQLTVPKYLGEPISFDKDNSSANVSGESYKADRANDTHELNVKLYAESSGLLNEHLCFTCADGKQFVLTLSARVLGIGKGTPLLKRGIHCTYLEQDNEDK